MRISWYIRCNFSGLKKFFLYINTICHRLIRLLQMLSVPSNILVYTDALWVSSMHFTIMYVFLVKDVMIWNSFRRNSPSNTFRKLTSFTQILNEKTFFNTPLSLSISFLSFLRTFSFFDEFITILAWSLIDFTRNSTHFQWTVYIGRIMNGYQNELFFFSLKKVNDFIQNHQWNILTASTDLNDFYELYSE